MAPLLLAHRNLLLCSPIHLRFRLKERRSAWPFKSHSWLKMIIAYLILLSTRPPSLPKCYQQRGNGQSGQEVGYSDPRYLQEQEANSQNHDPAGGRHLRYHGVGENSLEERGSQGQNLLPWSLERRLTPNPKIMRPIPPQ